MSQCMSKKFLVKAATCCVGGTYLAESACCRAGMRQEKADAMRVRRVVGVALGCAWIVAFGSLAKAEQKAEDAQAVKTACGAMDVNFSVQETAMQSVTSALDGKALVYVFEDVQSVPLTPAVNFRVGLNGNWIGALKGNTYMGFAVDPGVQHLCIAVQGHALFQLQKGITLRQLQLEAGKTYFLRVRQILGKEALPLVFVEPVDADEAALLMQTMQQAVWEKK